MDDLNFCTGCGMHPDDCDCSSGIPTPAYPVEGLETRIVRVEDALRDTMETPPTERG